MTKKSLLDLFGIEKSNKQNKILDESIFSDHLLVHTIKNRIIEQLMVMNIDNHNYDKNEINRILDNYKLSELERSYIFSIVDDEINNYGPLTELISNDNVLEVMVNGIQDIYAEIDGKIIKQDNISFVNNDHIMKLIERLLKRSHRTLNNSNIINVRLRDGYKLSAIIPPLAINGPILTIKKGNDNVVDIEDMLRMGTMTPYMARFLEAAVLAKMNILICGNSGSGKTSLLNVLANLIPNHERVISVEENRELKLKSPHVITLEMNSDIEKLNVKDLVINGLNMRPDRLVIGEIKGEEAFSIIYALNIGLEGVMTTIYANSPEEAITRLETYILSSGKERSKQVIREYIINTIDLIVHIERLSDGRRKIVNISEINNNSIDEIKLRDIFAFNKKGITDKNFVMGEFVLYKFIPNSYKKMKTRGINTLTDIFDE